MKSAKLISLPYWCLVLGFLALLSALLIVKPGFAESTSDALTAEVVGAHANDKESQQVLDALQNLMQSLARKDINAVGECLSPDVVFFYAHENKMVYGKQDVLDHINKTVLGNGSNTAVKSLVLYNPYVNIKGDTAMVSFRAVKELTGAHPAKLESWCSEVYERKDGQWKVLHFASNWQPMHGK